VRRFDNKIVWVTGAGSGIGEAAGIGLATGRRRDRCLPRRRDPLEQVAAHIRDLNSVAFVSPAIDGSRQVRQIGEAIKASSAVSTSRQQCGLNINDRHWTS